MPREARPRAESPDTPRRRTSPRLWLAAGLAAALAVAWSAGVRFRIEPADGWSTGVDVRFAADPSADDLAERESGGPAARDLEVRNLVLLIGDGMGLGHLMAGRSGLAGMDVRLALERLPVTGWLTTRSSDRLVTDSAAAATALATGHKTENRRVGTTAEGEPVMSLTEAARERGKAVGLVTDSFMWDATPAAFAAHVESRRDYEGVAAQMAAAGFEVLLGEEDPGLADDDEGGGIPRRFTGRGYRIVRRPEDLAGAGDGSLLALFDAGAVDDPGRAPALADLAAFALDRLAADADGFVLLVETEETDSGAHRHDFHRVARGMAALDRAVEVAVDFARRDRRTLVVVTSDHETGGLSVLRGVEGGPLRIRWATGGHTANPVPLFAYGPGAEALGGVRDNTELPRILARLLGLELR